MMRTALVAAVAAGVLTGCTAEATTSPSAKTPPPFEPHRLSGTVTKIGDGHTRITPLIVVVHDREYGLAGAITWDDDIGPDCGPRSGTEAAQQVMSRMLIGHQVTGMVTKPYVEHDWAWDEPGYVTHVQVDGHPIVHRLVTLGLLHKRSTGWTTDRFPAGTKIGQACAEAEAEVDARWGGHHGPSDTDCGWVCRYFVRKLLP